MNHIKQSVPYNNKYKETDIYGPKTTENKGCYF